MKILKLFDMRVIQDDFNLKFAFKSFCSMLYKKY